MSRNSWLFLALLALIPRSAVRAADEKLVLTAPAGSKLEDVRKDVAPLLARIEGVGYRGVTAAAIAATASPQLELFSRSGFTDAMRREILALAQLPASQASMRVRYAFETEREASQWEYPNAPDGADWILVLGFKLDPRVLAPKDWDATLASRMLVRKDVVLAPGDFTFGRWDLANLETYYGEEYTRTKDPVCCPLSDAGLRKLQPLLAVKPPAGKEKPGSYSAVLLLNQPNSERLCLGYSLGGTLAQLKLEKTDAPRWAYWQMKEPLPSLGHPNLELAELLIRNPLSISFQPQTAK